MPERIQKLIDTKLELQNVRNQVEQFQNRFVIMFLTAPVWGLVAQKWASQGDEIWHPDFIVTFIVMIFGGGGYFYYEWKHRHLKRITGLPKEYMGSEGKAHLKEAAETSRSEDSDVGK